MALLRVARVLKAGKILRVQKLMRGAALEAYENAMATSAGARLALKAQRKEKKGKGKEKKGKTRALACERRRALSRVSAADAALRRERMRTRVSLGSSLSTVNRSAPNHPISWSIRRARAIDRQRWPSRHEEHTSVSKPPSSDPRRDRPNPTFRHLCIVRTAP